MTQTMLLVVQALVHLASVRHSGLNSLALSLALGLSVQPQ